MAQWLVKEEPDHYGYDKLEKDGKTVWAGVRNPLAQKHLRAIRRGDRIFYYHTGKEKAVIAIAKAASNAYEDPNDSSGKLSVVDVVPDKRLKRPVTLAEIKADKSFASFPLGTDVPTVGHARDRRRVGPDRSPQPLVRPGLLVRFLAVLGLWLVPTLASAQEARPADVLVSRQLAESENLTVGSVVRLATDAAGTRAREFRIAGIYEPTPDPSRLGQVPRSVRLHLPDLLEMTRPVDIPAGAEYVSSVNVALVDPKDADQFAKDVNARLPGVLALPAGEAAGSAGPFRVLERFHLAIAVVTIIAATVFLLALSIMLVDERRETVGVLRLIGLPVRRILMQILLEGLLVAGVGAIFGLILALLSEQLINQFFQWRYDTALVFVRITRDVALTCVTIAVPLGASATVVASWALLRRGGLRLARR